MKVGINIKGLIQSVLNVLTLFSCGVVAANKNTLAAISLELMHDPDIDNGGAGRAYVVNPTSETKSIHWVDNGTTAKAIILPVTSSGFSSLVDFKFYVSGVDNVAVSNLQAYDQNGVEIFTVGASATKH